ncbi:MAG: hypothetical protein LBJ86_01070 [Spirochaetaceae bacterium]|jgi:hypothetical protein|nr:hypothetical protein [Spirochaetaceae bacterium]
MRRCFIFALTLFTLGSGAVSVTAQQAQADAGPVTNSEFYVVQVSILKIYSYSKGYVVEYRKNLMGTEKLYLPLEWFTRTAGMQAPLKGEMVRLRDGSALPYLAIYYKGGKTDHVRLYVHGYDHRSWGNIPSGLNIDDNFNGVEEITIVY